MIDLGYIPPYLPYPVELWGTEAKRNAKVYNDVVRQFRVKTNARYQPGVRRQDGQRLTFCNIFLWDFTRAMKCEIPHWVSPEGGIAPVGKGKELTANGVVTWLHEHGKDWGWEPCSEASARSKTLMGIPCVAVWQNHTSIGHVAVVVPAGYDITYIAQAGASNFEFEPIRKGFGNIKPEFWTHA